MSKSLLIDAMPIKLSLEEGGEDGKVIARGEFARCDKPTQNGRKYSRALYEREVGKLQEVIKRRRMFGELDHPADGKTMLQRVSHIVTKLEVADDGRVIGEAEILDTPTGKTLKAILSAGAEAGVSSRGFGSTKPSKDGKGQEVGDDFVLRTFDFVADPAMMTAYPDIFTEDVDQPEFTVEDLAASFPDLVQEAADRGAQDSMGEALELERQKVKAEMEEQFAIRLAESLDGLRESVLEDVKSEYESADASQAQVVVHKIAEILMPMVGTLTPEQEALEDALRAEESRAESLQNQLSEAKDMLKIAGYAMHVESNLGAHPKRESIKRLLGKVSHYESVEELTERLDEIKAEFEVVVEAERDIESANIATARGELKSVQESYEALLDENTALESEINNLTKINAQLEASTRRAEVTAYKRSKTSAHTNSQELLNLLESADSEAQVDEVVDRFGRQSVADSHLETLRQRVKRGNLRRESAVLEESSRSPSSSLDVSFSEIKALAGI